MSKVIFFILAQILLNSVGAQVNLSEYNYLVAPKSTEVTFSFPDTIRKPITLKIIQPNILDFISYVDTLIDPGTKKCLLSLNLETPRLFTIELDSNYSHIYLVPGVKSEIVFSSSMDGSHLNTDGDLHYIEKYYVEKYSALGVKRSIQEAFQFAQNSPDWEGTARILDSLSLQQHSVLMKYKDVTPTWFHRYEEKNIEYTSLICKLSVAYNLVYNQVISFDDHKIQSIVTDLNSADHVGLLTPFYLQCLKMVALLKYCDQGCISADDNGIISRHQANLKYMQKLDGEIRKAFATQTLILLYNSSGILPKSISMELESEVASSDYAQRLEKHKNPNLVNESAPNFYLKDLDDKFHSLRDYNGNVILLNFWFVGCKPCHQEIPFQ